MRLVGFASRTTVADIAGAPFTHERHAVMFKTMHRNVHRIGREIGQRAGDAVRIAGRVSCHYARQSPWHAVGIVALVAVAVGYALGRR